jgi:hypothetical protein
MLTKKEVLLSIKDMPSSFSVEDLVDRIILLQKIETGLSQSAKKQLNTAGQGRQKLKKWLSA